MRVRDIFFGFEWTDLPKNFLFFICIVIETFFF